VASRRRQGVSSVTLVLAAVLVLSVVVAGVGATLLRGSNVLRLGEQQQNVPPPYVDILVTAQEIQEGTELVPVLFRKESRPSRDFAAGRVVGGFEQLRGVYAKSFIPAGQPLLSELVTTKAPINSVVPKIRPGYRAISLKLDKQTTNEGWARAGVRVDVLLATSQGNRSSAAIIAQNLRVLSSGTSVSSEFGGESKMIQNGESTVTLEVSSEDQKRLTLAAGRGELRLLLRGDEDAGVSDEKLRIALDGVIALPGENPPTGPTDQGWVMIDGRKYKVVGAALVPG
jgi:Flp pilus assembly protein CpaB